MRSARETLNAPWRNKERISEDTKQGGACFLNGPSMYWIAFRLSPTLQWQCSCLLPRNVSLPPSMTESMRCPLPVPSLLSESLEQEHRDQHTDAARSASGRIEETDFCAYPPGKQDLQSGEFFKHRNGFKVTR